MNKNIYTVGSTSPVGSVTAPSTGTTYFDPSVYNAISNLNFNRLYTKEDSPLLIGMKAVKLYNEILKDNPNGYFYYDGDILSHKIYIIIRMTTKECMRIVEIKNGKDYTLFNNGFKKETETKVEVINSNENIVIGYDKIEDLPMGYQMLCIKDKK